MAEREHAAAIREAERTADLFRRLIAKMGTKEHPRGRILTAYRQARRALRGTNGGVVEVREVLAELRAAMMVIAQDTLWESAQQGSRQAQKQIELYGLPLGLDGYTPQQELAAWLASVDAQHAAVLGLASAGNLSAIVGDDQRVGALSPAPVIRTGARWLAVAGVAAASVATYSAIQKASAQEEFGKQAIAAIDERTTDCCLRVNGQVVPLSGQFRLTGTPRYADEMESPPFHNYCRTSEALVRMADANDDLSQAMRQAGIDELNARAATGTTKRIHPATATSAR